MAQEFSYPKNKIKILLLENIHQAAKEHLVASGYSVAEVPKSLPEEELLEAIKGVHILGIRSKTKVRAEHLQAAERLLALGCFGVGTNQVDLGAAALAGVPVFNAPYSSTRSVAELALAYILSLSRGVGFRNNKLHSGTWDKSAKGSYEVRDKTLGLIGYGHIGQQVGLLAEAVGMNVRFFDLTKRLPLGNARPIETMQELLRISDYVSLHVPAMADGRALIGKKELRIMRPNAFLLNLSRGSLVDLEALREAIQEGKIGGAGLDVYPVEPKTNKSEFACELAGLDNVLLTPHIGGSTEEAQRNIGLEVADSFQKFIDQGVTMGAVNFPQISLAPTENSHRILHIHKNVPGAAKEINKIVYEIGANINAQYLSTHKEVGYMVMDLDKALSQEVKQSVTALETNIRTRILY